MAATAHLYEIFIKAPRQRVWDALIKEEDTVRYFHGTRFESTFEPGAPYVSRMVANGAPAVDGVIEEFDPPNRLVMTWRFLYDEAMAAEPHGRVEWLLADANADGTVTRVTVRHGDLSQSPKTWQAVKLGWVGVLDNLKTLLETGEPMGEVDTAGPDGATDDAEAQWHRTQGITANNSIWELLDGRELSADDGDELLARAYASVYHWKRAARSGPINQARGAYMIAKAHTVLGQVDMAVHWIDRYAVLLAEAGDAAADFDHAYLHEGRARAYALAGRTDEARADLAAARAYPVTDEEDRKIYEADLAQGPWFGLA